MGLTSILISLVGFWESLYAFIFYTWPLLLVSTLFILRKKWKKYPLEAVIIEKRGDNLIETNDRVGKIEDKASGMTHYRLWKTKETIPVYNYEWILHARKVHTNFLEKLINLIRPTIGVMFLFKYGSKQYKPIRINQNPQDKLKLKEIKDKKGNPIYVYNYSQIDPRWVLGTLDFDVIDWDNMNFMVQEQRASTLRRMRKLDRFAKYIIPIALIAGGLLFAIFAMKFGLDAGRTYSGSEEDGGGGGSKVLGGIKNVVTPGQ